MMEMYFISLVQGVSSVLPSSELCGLALDIVVLGMLEWDWIRVGNGWPGRGMKLWDVGW
jgi:hypothetical protein